MPFANQFDRMAEKEIEQQRGDVVAVGVGIHQQDDLAVAQAVVVELVSSRRCRSPSRDRESSWLASTLMVGKSSPLRILPRSGRTA